MSDQLPAPISPISMMSMLSVAEVKARLDEIRKLVASVMDPKIHYDVIPGTNKPSLKKAGCDVLAMLFAVSPKNSYTMVRGEGKHREYISDCALIHIATQVPVAYGQGSCSTEETRYAVRKQGAECPNCKHPLMRSKYADRATGEKGWYCNTSRGGCGNNFSLKDERIGEVKEVSNPNLANEWNTCLKMANIRSYRDSIMHLTGVSEIFTQDMERREEGAGEFGREDDEDQGADKITRIQFDQLFNKVRAAWGITEDWYRTNPVAGKATDRRIRDELHKICEGKGYHGPEDILMEEFEAVVAAVIAAEANPYEWLKSLVESGGKVSEPTPTENGSQAAQEHSNGNGEGQKASSSQAADWPPSQEHLNKMRGRLFALARQKWGSDKKVHYGKLKEKLLEEPYKLEHTHGFRSREEYLQFIEELEALPDFNAQA